MPDIAIADARARLHRLRRQLHEDAVAPKPNSILLIKSEFINNFTHCNWLIIRRKQRKQPNFNLNDICKTERMVYLLNRPMKPTAQNNRIWPGDPALAADAIIKAVTAENPPLHLPLGAFAYERASVKLDEMKKEFAAWREVAISTDYKN